MTLDKNWWSDLEKLTSLCDADARKQRNLIEGFFFHGAAPSGQAPFWSDS